MHNVKVFMIGKYEYTDTVIIREISAEVYLNLASYNYNYSVAEIVLLNHITLLSFFVFAFILICCYFIYNIDCLIMHFALYSVVFVVVAAAVAHVYVILSSH